MNFVSTLSLAERKTRKLGFRPQSLAKARIRMSYILHDCGITPTFLFQKNSFQASGRRSFVMIRQQQQILKLNGGGGGAGRYPPAYKNIKMVQPE